MKPDFPAATPQAPAAPTLREQEQIRRAMRGIPSFPIRSVTASATLTQGDAFIVADTTSGSVTLTLPPVAQMTGRLLWVKKPVAANTVTLDGDGSDTIDGAATLAWTTQYQSYVIVSDGTDWWVV